jgi:ubiquinone/menaquinone biosynthesis C-methylase UbiE
MFATDRKLPVSGGAEKRSYVRAMFHSVAPTYDFLNHLLSANLDRRGAGTVDRLGRAAPA